MYVYVFIYKYYYYTAKMCVPLKDLFTYARCWRFFFLSPRSHLPSHHTHFVLRLHRPTISTPPQRILLCWKSSQQFSLIFRNFFYWRNTMKELVVKILRGKIATLLLLLLKFHYTVKKLFVFKKEIQINAKRNKKSFKWVIILLSKKS